MSISISPEPLLSELKDYHARFCWGQATGYYPSLGTLLVEIYRGPGSSSGIERNHKIGNQVLSQRRCRLDESNVQRQVSICHNRRQLGKTEGNKHQTDFETLLSKFASSADPCHASTPNDQDDINMEDFDEVDHLLNNALLVIESPSEISDVLLFNDEDE